MKLFNLLKRAQEKGACSRNIEILESAQSYSELREHKDVLFWVEWATNHGLLPAVYLSDYADTCYQAWDVHEAIERQAKNTMLDGIEKYIEETY